MRILVDMDGICVNLYDDWFGTYNREWKDNLKIEDVKGWNVHEYVRPECGKKIYQILNRPGFFDYLPALPGAVRSITELVERGHDVRFATASPSADGARGKVEWVRREFAHLNFGVRHVLQLHDKEWLKADMLIDDKGETIQEWGKAGRTVMAIEWPYNRWACEHATVYAKDYKNTEAAWQTIMKAIRKLEE